MEPKIAVLIDFENIAAGTEKEGLGKVNVGLIMNRLREKGKVLIARSYADWGRFARFKKDMLFESVQLFELSAHGMNDKNRADVALVVDCMELALTRDYIDTFVVVSGDSDFTPLIQKLRELDKRVIGLGTRRSTSRLIVEAVDEFIFYDTLRQQKTQRPKRRSEGEDTPNKLSREEAMELVTEALAALQREDPKPAHGSRIKEQLLRKHPAFNEADLGFSSFARFLEYCQKQNIISLSRDQKGGGYLVDAEDDGGGSESGTDLELSSGARKLYDILKGEELELLTREHRQALADAMMQVIADRSGRNKRVNIQWVTQDSAKKVRSGETSLNGRQVKSLVNVLHAQGVFRHTDGEPVRSFFAAFELGVKDAAGVMKTLDVAALKTLQEQGVALKKVVPDVAELLFGDRSKTRVVEELMAWELSGSPSKSSASKSAAKDADKDADKPAAKEAEKPADKEEAKKEEAPSKPKRTRAPRKRSSASKAAKPATASEDTKSAKADAPAEKEAAEAPAKAPAEAPEAPVKEAAEAPAEEAPAKAPAKRTTTKRSSTAKKTTAAKKTTTKKPAAKKTASAKSTSSAATEAPAEKGAEAAEAPAEAEKPAAKKTTRTRKPRTTSAAKKESSASSSTTRKRTTTVRTKAASAKTEASADSAAKADDKGES